VSVATENYWNLNLMRRAPPHKILDVWAECSEEEAFAMLDNLVYIGSVFSGGRLYRPASQGGRQVMERIA
jgi:hypothetical protein